MSKFMIKWKATATLHNFSTNAAWRNVVSFLWFLEIQFQLVNVILWYVYSCEHIISSKCKFSIYYLCWLRPWFKSFTEDAKLCWPQPWADFGTDCCWHDAWHTVASLCAVHVRELTGNGEACSCTWWCSEEPAVEGTVSWDRSLEKLGFSLPLQACGTEDLKILAS